jgi:hypothetical protein
MKYIYEIGFSYKDDGGTQTHETCIKSLDEAKNKVTDLFGMELVSTLKDVDVVFIDRWFTGHNNKKDTTFEPIIYKVSDVETEADINTPKATTYNSSAIENLEYIEKVVFQLINGNKDDIDRDDIYTSIAWLAEDLGYIYKNGGYMKKEDYLKTIK